MAGMITGTLVTILWKLFLKEPTGVYELIPAFLLSALAVMVLGSKEASARDEKGA
jgi:SSS family solute:Na+ symporter